MNKAKLVIFFILLMCMATNSYADRCWLTGGCENKIVYVYVPPTQYDDQNYKEYSCFTWLKVFKQKGLPEVGSIVEPHHNDIGWYYGLNDIKSKYHEVEKLFNYEEDRKERECLRFAEILSSDSPSWGGDMKVKILSYTKSEKGFFAQIKILTSK